jgi:transglutaminase-like putative cysteine protease
MSTVAAPSAPTALQSATGSATEAWSIRLVAYVALALYGGIHWADIVRPGAQGDLLGMLIVALAAGILLPSALELPGVARRAATTAALLLGALALTLLVAGVPAAVLRPDRWDTLVSQIASAIATLPALRVPYSGKDPWVFAVLLSGGGILLVASACLALLPHPRTFSAAACLGVLYGVAVVEHNPRHPYLDGAVFALLLGALLWADRLRGREAPVAVALAVTAVLGSALLAPHVASREPWVDYQALAERLQGGKSTTFTWNHDYAPLRWPRDGLELARVRDRGNLYLKTAALETFDGTAWRQATGILADGDDTEFAAGHPDWTQTIHVDIKGLQSEQFIGAGTTTFVSHSTRLVREATPGTFEVAAKPLRRGDSYDAQVYVPRPNEVQLHAAGTDYPVYVARQLSIGLPPARGSGLGRVVVTFAPWGRDQATVARSPQGFYMIDPNAALADSPYAREYVLARQLAAASTDPYDLVRKVIARVKRGARYTESPPPPGRLMPLDAFLFRDHAGYCQHFAGATALLLRMAGVPARVATGFSPGSQDGPDHVIRDLDAHSWVEVYFPHIGWVTFDPTPGDSPARSQQTDVAVPKALASSTPRTANTTAGDRLSDPAAGGAAGATGRAGARFTVPLAVGGAALLALGGLLVLRLRRRRRLARSGDPELEELRLALARSGRAPTNETTLASLERLLDGSEGALGYLRALRLARYGGGAAAPSAAQRRALRRELSAGLGVTGRLRALWALPPRSAELRDALRIGRRRSYTA